MRRILSGVALAAAVACDGDTSSAPTSPMPLGSVLETTYEIEVLDQTLGGSLSVGYAINSHGWVAGYSNETGNAVRQAVVWRDGQIEELGSLGGPSSSVVWTGLSSSGMIVGIAETADIDPLGESWSCTPFFATGEESGHVCRGFVWENGVMSALPTFGGTHSYAAGVNSRGQVVGWAENLVHEPTCHPTDGDQVLQFRAALWEPKRGAMRELPPWGDHSTSAATAINERGQAVGISGDCDVAVGRFSALTGVLWQPSGDVVNIGGLGGDAWHTPTAINSRGDVVGFSNPAEVEGGDFLPKAFIWTRATGIDSLPMLEGHAFSQAFAINTRGQVAGRSCGTPCRAVIWQDGVPVDLNELMPDGYPHHLAAARDITDSGVITGNLVLNRVGPNVPFIARPVPSTE